MRVRNDTATLPPVLPCFKTLQRCFVAFLERGDESARFISDEQNEGARQLRRKQLQSPFLQPFLAKMMSEEYLKSLLGVRLAVGSICGRHSSLSY